MWNKPPIILLFSPVFTRFKVFCPLKSTIQSVKSVPPLVLPLVTFRFSASPPNVPPNVPPLFFLTLSHPTETDKNRVGHTKTAGKLFRNCLPAV